MALKVYRNLEQGSQEWLDARCGLVTASTVGKLITPSTLKVAKNDTSRGLVATLAAERITGHVEQGPVSFDMMRGTQDEPFARDAYVDNYAPVTQVGFITAQFDGYTLGYSPDGLVGDDGLIEIKSRSQRIHLQTILNDKVPPANMAQIQCGLLVTGREWCDYVSFCAGMPLWTKRVEPDERWFNVITTAVNDFEADVSAVVRAYNQAVDGLPTTERIEYPDLVI